jgi:hypothetical protein
MIFNLVCRLVVLVFMHVLDELFVRIVCILFEK